MTYDALKHYPDSDDPRDIHDDRVHAVRDALWRFNEAVLPLLDALRTEINKVPSGSVPDERLWALHDETGCVHDRFSDMLHVLEHRCEQVDRENDRD